jgi:peptidoglycan hydrolase CwlO-like protein
MKNIHFHFRAWGYPTKPIEVKITQEIDGHGAGQITNLLNNVMSELQNLTVKVDELTAKAAQLQQTLDSEQAQVAALIAKRDQAIADLTAQKAALEEQIANGATPEQLATIAAGIDAVMTSLSATDADLAGTVADAPVENPGGGEVPPITE